MEWMPECQKAKICLAPTDGGDGDVNAGGSGASVDRGGSVVVSGDVPGICRYPILILVHNSCVHAQETVFCCINLEDIWHSTITIVAR